jgi:hypothetical protein
VRRRGTFGGRSSPEPCTKPSRTSTKAVENKEENLEMATPVELQQETDNKDLHSRNDAKGSIDPVAVSSGTPAP